MTNTTENTTTAPLHAVRTPEGVELHPETDALAADQHDRLLAAVDELFDNRTIPLLGDDEREVSEEIGAVYYDGSGAVVDITVETSHRKPTEREDGRDPMSVFEAVGERDSTRNRQQGDPIQLRRDGTSWRLSFGPEAREAGIEAGDYVAVDLEDGEYDPLLVIGLLPEPPENPSRDPFTRKVMERGDSLAVNVPGRHMDDRGLGLDPGEYDNETPLLFEPLVDNGLVGLAPLGYADGREYVPRGHRDGDPGVDAAPDPETEQVSLAESTPETPEGVGAIPPEAIQAAAQTTGVDAETVERALQLLANDCSPDALADYRVRKFDAVETPEGTVYVVSSDVWEALDATSRLDGAVRQAVRQAHVRAAELLLEDYMPESDARGFAASADAIVLDL